MEQIIKKGLVFFTREIALLLLCSCGASFFQASAQNRVKKLPASAAVVRDTETGRRAAENITARKLKDYLEFVAADEMEGRGTPSRGLDLTAKFLALNLSQASVKPGGENNSYFQPIALRRTKINAAETRADFGSRMFAFGRDFLVSTPTDNAASAPLVFVGHGWIIKAKNIDAYDGVDVKDKIMIVSGGGFPPREAGGSFPLPGKQGDDWEHPYNYALSHGAKGIIFIPGYPALTRWEYESDLQAEGVISVEKFQASDPARIVYESPLNPRVIVGLPIKKDGGLPVITASAQMTTVLFAGEEQNASVIFQKMTTGAAMPAFDLNQSKRLNLSVRVREEMVSTQNVVGIVEGGDPVLKNEYVAVGAHYDHLGIGMAVNGDSIYNGADDDGSGTVALLAMAQSLMLNPVRPRRSILFVWHAGEEKGLWGSRYFTESPTVPLEKIVAQLNIDMIGRSKSAADRQPANQDLSGADEIYVIGSKLMSTNLYELSERVNRDYLNLKFNYKYDDPEDSNRFFYRSDHYNYARKGIPIIYYFNGSHADYHQPSDTFDKIDYIRMEKIARTVFLTVWELANAEKRPRVDKPLPPDF